uniref:DNA binding protein putative n=1 Tax=Albugo laibachii Nc14 TaxID=890382 RepID=F0WZ45_9STRA|nr:DNA binding protein putative [Albugo laibachii Nc14]|eukprot:CCA26760.1 DNA binding protein putative [Albugo laibachii Nc14]
MPTTKIRIRLTQSQKLELREHFAAQPEQTQRMVCMWAQEHFKLPRRLPISMLWDVLRSKDGEVLSTSRKTNQPVRFPQLEAELVRWIAQCERLKLPFVNGDTICAKAHNIRVELLLRSSPSVAQGLNGMKSSSGWIFKFQKRNCLSSKRVHGEASTVSETTVSTGRVLLKQVTRGYEGCNILNMDETAYSYCASPTSTITRNRISGRKQVKKLLTVAAACSADGSRKLPIFFVGRPRQPRCFESKVAEDLDLEYGNIPKGWMNTRLIQGWVSRLDA